MTRAPRGPCRGAASAEWLVVAPAVLAVGFGVLQWALLMHGRASVEYAAFQGARAGATSHAEPAAIVGGLAMGLIGIRNDALTSAPVSISGGDATALLGEELARGVASWRQLRPTPEDFADWAVPARDDEGRALDGTIEIPNDNLRYRGDTRGARSGRSLVEANLLEVEFVYAWPMRVPLIGSLAVRWMEWFDRCDGAVAPAAGYRPWGRADWRIEGGSWRCPYYRAGGVPRWPLRVVASARMHSTARHAGSSPAGALANEPAGPAGPASGPLAGDPAPGRDVGGVPEVDAGSGPGAESGGDPREESRSDPAAGEEAAASAPPDAEPAPVNARADISQPGECFADPEPDDDAGPAESASGSSLYRLTGNTVTQVRPKWMLATRKPRLLPQSKRLPPKR